MRIVQGTRHLISPSEVSSSASAVKPIAGSVLTIGNFDGLHLGHQALIRRVVERAREKSLPAIAMTFDPHPVKVLYPDRKLHRIFDLDDQLTQMERLGIDIVVVEPFSREFSQLPPDRYLLEWIYRPFTPETLVVGYDFSFGANRLGSIDFLKEHATALGTKVEVVPPVKVGDVLVSSSRIRQAVEAGDVELAAELLGRSFYINGLIVKGAGRGRTIGVPTANLRTQAETVPARGVYAAWAEVRGKKWMAAVNVGFNPTFVEAGVMGAPSVEAHLIEFLSSDTSGETSGDTPGDTPGSIHRDTHSDIYGESLRLDFVAKLRDEKKFASVTELVAQIQSDVAASKVRLLAAAAVSRQ